MCAQPALRNAPAIAYMGCGRSLPAIKALGSTRSAPGSGMDLWVVRKVVRGEPNRALPAVKLGSEGSVTNADAVGPQQCQTRRTGAGRPCPCASSQSWAANGGWAPGSELEPGGRPGAQPTAYTTSVTACHGSPGGCRT